MDQITSLKNLGLSDQEAGVYLALLKLGGAKASIIAKEVGIKRTTAYATLTQMAKKGFVNVYFRKSRRFYYAQKPTKIALLFKKKVENFSNIIPFLESLDKKQAQTFGLRFIETKRELEEFYVEILEEYKNREYSVIGNTKAWEGVEPEFFTQYRKNRAKVNIRTRLLLTSDSEKLNPTDSKLLRDYRFLPKKCQFKSTIDIFDDKILIVNPSLSSLAIVIAIPAMTDVFHTIFELLWSITPKK